MSGIEALFTDANTQWVLIGTLLLGLASGVLGSFALLKKQSLIGDAMAHAALPGICVAFLIIQQKDMLWLLIGAAISGLIGTYFIQAVVRHSRIKEDTSIGLVLSVFFGFGIVLLTYIQHNSGASKSGLDDFIFGQAASLVGTDVKVISTIAFILVIITAALFKELKLMTFDPQFAQGIGLPTRMLNGLFMTLIVLAVVIGLQAVGVILMSALLITPAITARYWTERLDVMACLSGVVGMLSGVSGTILSATITGMPTGPMIILSATTLFLFSMIFAPNRGLVAKAMKHMMIRRKVRVENTLIVLYEQLERVVNHEEKLIPTIKEERMLEASQFSTMEVSHSLKKLQRKSLIFQPTSHEWSFTKEGLEKAHQLVLSYRFMEVYLMNEMKYGHLHLRTEVSDFNDLQTSIKEEFMNLLKQYDREPTLLHTLVGRLPNSYDKKQKMSTVPTSKKGARNV
ncbi:metal ABC transporter permease [Bacillus sp. CGMCC 1.16541]|uniref:metal ABC transporter permease n=1 Tax=Bacillus sp. CGMCC 1.16541 TaxID=2185143 RepID=UPI000D72ADE6|nr:metal ABC transporter permease [Bacillus sp. CGMCC 1.16541]